MSPVSSRSALEAMPRHDVASATSSPYQGGRVITQWSRNGHSSSTADHDPANARGRGHARELFHHGFEALGADAADNHRGFEGGWTMPQLEALRELVGD